MENVVHQLLVVNRAKERMNKFRKKIANGDISSAENFFECCAFGLKGVPQIAFLDDPTRKASMHDVNLSEVRELVLGLLGKRILVPRYFKLKNAPFVRQVVHVHIGHVPAAINPNTTLSRGGPSALVTGLALSDVKCVRVDREIDEQGALPYKFLTVPYSKHFELALPNTTEPAPAVTTSTNAAANASTGSADVSAALTEEQQAAHTLAPYVLTPAQLHLWDYPSMLLVTETMKSINSDNAVDTTESEDSQPTKRARLDPDVTATTAVEASSSIHSPTVGVFSGAEYIPTASEAQQILSKLGYTSWVAASATSGAVTSSTPLNPVLVAAIDCEMCDTAQGSELTRISVLSFEGAVLLDTLVMPPRAIVNYQTQYSGITEEMLKGVTVTLEQVQVALLRLFTPATILIGHSLDSDLRALRLVHNRCLDTALIYPHPRGFPMRLKLKKLAEDYLQLRIQNNTAKGHDSTEDAKAALQLALLKGANGPLFGVKNPDQQRFPLMSVLDPVSTDAVLLWVGEKAIEKTLEKAIKSNMIGDDSCIVRTAISVREEDEKVEENSDSVVAPAAGTLGAPITTSVATPVDTPTVSSCGPDSCTGGTARTQQVTSNAAAMAALCAQLAAPVCAGDCYTVHTTEDKSLGPISSWVASPHTGNNNIQSVTVPKRKYLFANLKYPQATEYDEFASELHAQIDAIRATIAAADAVQGYLPGTLLVVTAQETHAPVVALIQRKRVLSRATMAAAMWSAEDEMKLKEMRKHNLAYMAAAVV